MDPSKPVSNNPTTTVTEDSSANARIEFLLEQNRQYAKISKSGISEVEQLEAKLLKNPISTESAVSQLGLFTGLIPTSALFISFALMAAGPFEPGAIAIVLMIVAAVATTSAVGYYSGPYFGKALKDMEQRSWPLMLATLPFIGMTWGLLAGSLGGIFLFGIGAIFGGVIGSVVGTIVLTAFGIAHRILKKDDMIESNQFLPLAIGINAVIVAFVLGFFVNA